MGRVPLDAGFDHEVDNVSVFDVVFFEELVVRERFAFQQEPLCVCEWCGEVGTGELGFDGADGVCGLDGEGVRHGWFDRFKCDIYR